VNTGSDRFDIRFGGAFRTENAIRYDGIEGGAVIDAIGSMWRADVASVFRQASRMYDFCVDSTTTRRIRHGTEGRSRHYQIGTIICRLGFEYLRDVLDARILR
jgi:hypothetical protein